MIILYSIIIYFIFVWVVIRLVVPHMGFRKSTIPALMPNEIQTVIDEINQNSKSDMDFIKNAYAYVTRRYTGSRIKTITQFWRAFGNVYTKDSGFLPCSGQNFLLRTILIKSGRFNEGDIKVKVVPLNFFIHQYISVYVEGNWIDIDPWSHFLKIGFGEKLAYFG